jgi:hypothetical protein
VVDQSQYWFKKSNILEDFDYTPKVQNVVKDSPKRRILPYLDFKNYSAPFADSSLCTVGFTWNNNSCAFDCVMTIIIQFNLEIAVKSKECNKYLENMGCLGEILQRKNIFEESSFDPAYIRDELYNMVRGRGIIVICIHISFCCQLIV